MPRDGSGVYTKPANTTASPNTTIESTKFNTLIDDITADLNTDRPVVAGGTGASSAGDARANLGAQAQDATLDSLAALGTAADRLAYTTGADTWAEAPISAFGRSLIDDIDASAARATLGVPDTFVPTGAIFWFGANTPPTGYLECNGVAVSRTNYATLFTVIGTTYGVGDGSTTFNLPDLRGEFVRGWDNGRGVDSGRGFGSTQSDELRSHTHVVAGVIPSGGSKGVNGGGPFNNGHGSIGATGGSETRPRNIALLSCIKY